MTPLRKAIVIAACSSAVFVLLTILVTHDLTQAFDEAFLRSMRNADDLSVTRGTASLGDIARDVTALGSVTVLVVLIGVVVAYLLMRRHRGPALLVALSALGGLGASVLLKLAVGRARPDVVPH